MISHGFKIQVCVCVCVCVCVGREMAAGFSFPLLLLVLLLETECEVSRQSTISQGFKIQLRFFVVVKINKSLIVCNLIFF